MSIQSEITRITNGVAAAKTAVTSKGGTVSTTSVDDLATEIATIPQGGQPEPTEPSLYGRVTYYKNKKIVVDGELMCQMCTAEIVDADKFSDFMGQQQNASYLDMTYQQDQWRVGWETIVEDPLEEMGMEIELEPGTSFATISGQLSGTYCEYTVYDFESLSEINGLCNYSTKTINNKSIDNAAILDFEWGTTTPTTIGNYFLYGCNWSKCTIPSTVASIGQSFCESAVVGAAPGGITAVQPLSVGNNFMSNAVFRDSVSIDFSRDDFTFGTGFLSGTSLNSLYIHLPDAVPDGFLLRAKTRNITFSGYPTSIGNNFLRGFSFGNPSYVNGTDFTKNVVSVGTNFLSSIDCSDSERNSARAVQRIINNFTELTTIGTYFLQGAIILHTIIIPSTVTSIGNGFLSQASVLALTVNTDALPSDYSSSPNTNCSFMQFDETDTAYVRGVLLSGSSAQRWKDSIADSDSPYAYRKLVLA